MNAEEKEPQSDVPEDTADADESVADDIVLEEEDEQPKDTIKRLRENLKECTAQKKEYLDNWQRTKADLINQKKEFVRERERLEERTIEQVIADILPVLDSFEMAFADEEAWNRVDEQWRSGVEQIYNQLLAVLKTYDVSVIKPAVGDEFDPRLHTSVDTKTADEDEQTDTVARCEKTGYRRGERIIRSANVVVFKNDTGEEA